jgi:hypothetical protein
MSGRSAALLAAVLLVAVVAVAALTLPRQGQVAASPSPSPIAQPTPSATPTASPATTPTATPSPSPSPEGGRFVNAEVGYSLELPPPWRRSGCFSHASGSGSDATASDTFLKVSAYDEESGHTGIPYDLIEVHARPNPDDLTPRQWWDGGRTVWPRESFSRVSDTTIAARTALRIDDSPHEGVLVASETHMFEIRNRERRSALNGRPERAAIIATFRIMTAEELAAARARPAPTPAPARAAEQIADVLAEGFARQDIALLASVIQPHCVTIAVAQGGGSSMSSEKYLDELEARFARGLTVEVRRDSIGPAEFFQDGTLALQSTWKEPGGQDVEVDLLISPERTDRWSWRGALLFFVGR